MHTSMMQDLAAISVDRCRCKLFIARIEQRDIARQDNQQMIVALVRIKNDVASVGFEEFTALLDLVPRRIRQAIELVALF